MNLDIKVVQENSRTIVYLSGEIDVYTAPRLREQLFSFVEQKKHTIVIDLAHVEFMDSSGLGTIIGALKTANKHESKLILQRANDRLQRLFSITGLAALVEINNGVEGGIS